MDGVGTYWEVRLPFALYSRQQKQSVQLIIQV